MIATVTKIAGLTDYVALQDDLTSLILCHAPLYQVNATQERKLLMESGVAIDSLWSVPRNNGSGAGVIVEDIRPITRSESNTLVTDLLCGFVILAERNIATGPAGCGMHPEQIEQLVADLLDQKLLQPYGQLRADGNFGEPATDWINEEAGIYARRLRFKILNARKKTATCDVLTITAAAGEVTLACTQSATGLQIWFTTDGSFPANSTDINAAAQLYSAPFAAAAGTVVRALAYAPNLNPSALKQITV